MGIRKKLVLASLVSTTMVLAFLIGFVPALDAPGVRADDGIDMKNVLDAMIGSKAASQAPVITTPRDGVTVKVPSDQADSISLRVNIEPAAGDSPDNIAIGVDGLFFPDENMWWGDGDLAAEPPYTWDVPLSILTLDMAHRIYAFADVGLWTPKTIETAMYVYDEMLMDFIDIDVMSGDGLDGDGNGIPDLPMADVLPGQIWTALNSQGALVIMMNLEPGAAKYDLSEIVPIDQMNIHIEPPTTAMLQDAGLIPAEAAAYIVVSLGENLNQILDDLDGSGALTDAVLAQQPEDRLLGMLGGTVAQYVEISIIYEAPGFQYAEVDSLINPTTQEPLPVVLTMESIDAGAATAGLFLSYPTDISGPLSSPAFTVADDSGWSDSNAYDNIEDGVLTVELTSLSLFAPFVSALAVYDVVPAEGPSVGGDTVRIDGAFPVGMVYDTVAAAEAAYNVYFDSAQAFFVNDPSVFEDPGAPQILTADFMYVTAPAGVYGLADVTVVDKENPTRTATLVDGYQYLHTLTTDVEPAGAGTVDPSGVTGVTDGDSVNVSATANAGWLFDHWMRDGADAGTSTTLSVTVTSDTDVTAVFAKPPVQLDSVVPPSGSTGGNNQVVLSGAFLLDGSLVDSVAAAAAVYSVYFDTTLAAFDDSVPQIVTADAIYVVAPPHAAGAVNVRVEDAGYPANAAELVGGYTYVTPTITVTPDPATVDVGGSVTLSASSTDPLDASFAWASDNESVATVDAATGEVTGVAVGTANISATGSNSGEAGTAEVTVASVNITGVDPVSGLMAGGNAVAILGDFGVINTVAEAEALYTVTFGAAQATFDASLAKAVSAAGALYVVAPAQAFAEDTAVSVRVTSVANTSDFSELAAAYTYILPVVTVTPETAEILAVDTTQLSAVSNDPADTFAWVSDDEGVATVDANGLVTGVAAGTAVITATGTNSGAFDTATITVTARPVVNITGVDPVEGPMVGGNVVEIAGDFGAIASVAEAEALYTVTFGAQQATFDISTAGAVGVAGAIYVVAPAQTFVADTPVTVRVEDAGDATNASELANAYTYIAAVVIVSPDPASVRITETVQLSATSDDANDTSFTWVSDDETVATVDANGLVTGAGVGSATITATGSSSGVPGYATVNVTSRDAINITAVDPTTGLMAGGNAVAILGDFGAIATVAEAEALYTVTFGAQQATFDDSLAKAVAVAGALYVVAPTQNFLADTPVTVRVEDVLDATNGSELVNAYTYTLEPAAVVTVTPAVANIAVGGTALFSAASTDVLDTSFAWTSDDTSVATVNATTGVVAGVGVGSTTIRATGSNSGVVGTATVNVSAAPVVTVTPDPATVQVGNTVQLSATSTDALDTTFTWASSDTGVATVDQSSGEVTGVAEGSALIFATGANSGAVGSATVNVTAPVVTVTLATTSVLVGNTVQLSASSTDALDTSFTWASDDTDVATVNAATGLVTGVAEGTATISATGSNSGSVGTATVDVVTEGACVMAPTEAWIFGGVVAQITCAGFTDQTTVTFGDVEADIIGQTASELLVVVPPSDDTGTADTVDVTVTVEDGGTELVTYDFTYVRYESAGGVDTTAFIYGGTGDLEVTAKLTGVEDATLTLPVAEGETPGALYGLIRGSATPETALGTDIITDELGDGSVIPNVWGFDVHVYEPLASTAGLEANDMAYVEIDDWLYELSDEDPGTLEFDVTDAGLTLADVQNGLTLWSTDYNLNYATGATRPFLGVTYHSILTDSEVTPPLTEGSDPTAAVTTVTARLYELSLFSLRKATSLPSSLIDDVRDGLMLDPVMHPDGTAKGSRLGGTAVRLYSAAGGLDAVYRVEFGTKSKWYHFGIPRKVAVFVEPDTPTQLDVTSPKVDRAGWTDITVYMKGPDGNDVDPVVIKRSFKYTMSIFRWILQIVLAPIQLILVLLLGGA